MHWCSTESRHTKPRPPYEWMTVYVFLRRFQLFLRRFFGASHRAMMDSVLSDEGASTVNAIAGVCMACFFFCERQFP